MSQDNTVQPIKLKATELITTKPTLTFTKLHLSENIYHTFTGLSQSKRLGVDSVMRFKPLLQCYIIHQLLSYLIHILGCTKYCAPSLQIQILPNTIL
jgi:hypothetical protein